MPMVFVLSVPSSFSVTVCGPCAIVRSIDSSVPVCLIVMAVAGAPPMRPPPRPPPPPPPPPARAGAGSLLASSKVQVPEKSVFAWARRAVGRAMETTSAAISACFIDKGVSSPHIYDTRRRRITFYFVLSTFYFLLLSDRVEVLRVVPANGNPAGTPWAMIGHRMEHVRWGIQHIPFARDEMPCFELRGDLSSQDDPPLDVVRMQVTTWNVGVDCGDRGRRCASTRASASAIRIGRIVGIGESEIGVRVHVTRPDKHATATPGGNRVVQVEVRTVRRDIRRRRSTIEPRFRDHSSWQRRGNRARCGIHRLVMGRVHLDEHCRYCADNLVREDRP